MSGSTIGGIVGGAIGFFFGAPQVGYVIGSAIGGAVDPEEIRGPNIGDAQQQSSQAGVPRPVVYGHPAPFRGNIIDGESKARKVEQTESAKGGPEVTTERFLLTSAIRICEGPIAGVLKVWRNDQLVMDRTADDDFPDWEGASPEEIAAYIASLRAKTNAFDGRIALYFGTEDQLPDPSLEAIHGVGNTPYYRGTAYMVVIDDDVTDMRGASAQWKFEVLSAATEGPAPSVTPNADPPPFFSRDGGIFPGVEITEDWPVNGTMPPITKAPLVRIVASMLDSYTEETAYAPSTGHFPVGNGHCPSRIVLFAASGAQLFDSGWMGFPFQQVDLNMALSDAGFPGATIVPATEVVRVLTLISSTQNLRVTQYRVGFPPEGATTTVLSGSRIEVQFPDPDLLPDTVRVTPEAPGTLLGSDGQLYWPEWETPTSVTTLTPGDVFVGPTIADIAERCNVPASKLDVSALATEVLPGLLVAQQGPGADCIRPLQRGYFFDMPEFDLKLRATLRGAATVADITTDDLLDIEVADAQVRPQEVEYPRLVSVVTQDPDANYAPVPQTSLRTSPDVRPTSEVMLSLAIPFRADESKRIAEKLHKVLWAQAEGSIELPLPEKYSALVPSDCITYADRRWLIEQTDYAEGEIRVQARYDRASAYTSSAIGQPAQPPALPSTGLAGPTLFAWMNISLLSDLDDRLGFYVAVAGVDDGWRGAVVQVSADDGATWTDMATISRASVMGALVTDLPMATFAVIDTENVVRVEVRGELSSITEEQLLNEGNACLIGDELCQFQTADFVSEGVYDLSTLTRGRLDSAPAEHVEGSRFVLLNAPVFIEAPSGWIGRNLQMRAVSIGTAAASTPVLTGLWLPARSQTEWAPVQFVGTRDSSNNIALQWVGRGRLGTTGNPHHSSFFDGFRITFTKSGVSRTYATTANTFAYTAAQQTADFGSATGTLSVEISAMNRITGASEALTGSIP